MTFSNNTHENNPLGKHIFVFWTHWACIPLEHIYIFSVLRCINVWKYSDHLIYFFNKPLCIYLIFNNFSSQRKNIQSEVSHFNKPLASGFTSWISTPINQCLIRSHTLAKNFPWDHQGCVTEFLALPNFRRKYRKL